jgi:Cu(I)/Ag(I) efflux system periplasmic protein CusF
MNIFRIAPAMALALALSACGQGNEAAQGNAAATAVETYSGTGKVTAVAGDEVTIAHGPIAGIGWPAMSMTFRAATPAMAGAVKPGDAVSFQFRKDGSAYALTSLTKS